MQLAAHTYTFRDRPLEDALDAIAGLGFARVEVWVGHAAGPDREVARAVERRGLTVTAVGAGGFYTADREQPRRVFELARALRAPRVVACVNPELAAGIAARLPSWAVLCVENHWDQPLARPRELQRLLAAVPRLRACLDTGHATLAGVPAHRYPEVLGARLAHVHLKEARGPAPLERVLGRRLRRRLLPRPAPVFPGEGALDVPRLLDALRKAGFAGTITLEHEGDEPEAALRELRDRVRSAAPTRGAPTTALR